MGEYLQLVIDWVAQHSLWAGWLVFLVAFAESVAILGLLVPGVVLMFGFGALIANGALTFWPVFGWAVAGAVAGDSLSFWLGHRYQTHLYQLWPFRRHPRSLQQGVHFFERYGGQSVAFGRFFGPVRAVIPLGGGDAEDARLALPHRQSALGTGLGPCLSAAGASCSAPRWSWPQRSPSAWWPGC